MAQTPPITAPLPDADKARPRAVDQPLPPWTVWAPAVAGIGLIVQFAYVMAAGQPDGVYRPFDAVLFVTLTSTLVAYQAFPLLQGGARWPARLAGAGIGLIALGVAIGFVANDDPEWFFMLAGPGLLSWLLGSIVIAVRTWRSQGLPRAIAPFIALLMPLAVIGSEAGTGVIAGATMLVVSFVAARRRSVG